MEVGKRNFEWPQATVWDGFFTQDKLGGVTQKVDPTTVMTKLVAEGFFKQGADWLQLAATPSSVPTAVGVVSWNPDEGTLDVQQPGGVTLQVGQEVQIHVRNQSGVTIPNGGVVYLTGAQGNRPTVALAEADVVDNSRVVAVATQDIPNNSEGFVTRLGVVRELNTDAWAEGAELFLSDVPGVLTTTAPTSRTVRVGYVVRKHATVGSILVAIQVSGEYLPLSGGTVDGPLNVTGNISTAGTLRVSSSGNAWFKSVSVASDITASGDVVCDGNVSGNNLRTLGTLRIDSSGNAYLNNSDAVSVKTGGTVRINSTGDAFFPTLSVTGLTNGKLPRVSTVSGLMADSCFGDDGTLATCTRPLTLNGATRPGWDNAVAAGLQVDTLSSVWQTASGTRLGRNLYYGAGAYRAIASGSATNYPAFIGVLNDGSFAYYASNVAPVAGAALGDLNVRFVIGKTGGAGFYGATAPTSRPAVTGSKASNAALASLITALAACGIISDSTT